MVFKVCIFKNTKNKILIYCIIIEKNELRMLGESLRIQLRLRNVISQSSIGSRNAPTI